MRRTVKSDPKVIEKFKEYGVPLSKIDGVYVEFCKLDVSAKTKDKKIYLNEKMLEEGSDVEDPTDYLVHELMHFLQQSTGNVDDKKQSKDYLDRPTEQEAFKAQIDYKKREESPGEPENYVDGLLDHHDIKKEDEDKYKKKLLGK